MIKVNIENLSKSINNIPILHNMSFSIGEGEIMAYLGPNGAGKSTTVNILATLLKPSSGYVNIAGYDVETQPNDVRKLIGYLQEDFSLYPELTVYENLDFWAKLYGLSKKERIARASNS